MKKLIKELIYKDINIHNDEFMNYIKIADIKGLKDSDLNVGFDGSYDKQTYIFFILEYKLSTLIEDGDRKGIAYANYLISYFLFIVNDTTFFRGVSY